MNDKIMNPEKQNQADRQKKRLAEQLRANLSRRKAQLRSRRAGEADERDTGIAAAGQANQATED